jgi:hypothetical protein
MAFQEPILQSNLSLFPNNSLEKDFDKCLLEEFNYSKKHYKEILNFNTDIIKNINVIVMIFAGRKQYLEYNLNYMRKLLKENLINEVHLWLYTNDINDTKYIKDNSNLYRTCGTHQEYSEIFTKIEDNSFNISIKIDNTIFIKLNNIYEIILNNNSNNYVYIYENYRIKNKKFFNTSINFSITNFVDLKLSIKEQSLIIEANNKKYLNYKIMENLMISKIEIKSDGIACWKYKQIRNVGIFLYYVHNKNVWRNMLEAYNYYLEYDFDIIIKIDDDVIYFSDTDSFSRYIFFTYLHPEVKCVYSNSLNNMISFTYSGIHGLVDNYLTEKRKNANSTLFKYSYYYMDFETAKKLHLSFIENPDKYLQKFRMPINIDNCLNINYKNISGGDNPFYVSSHVFSFTKANYNFFFDKSKTNKRRFWDEGYILFEIKKKVFYPNFYSIHLAFSPQRRSKVYNANEIFEKYKNLTSYYL